MKAPLIPVLLLALMSLPLSACSRHEEQHQEEHHKIVATSPQLKSVTRTERYVCQIHSQRHINVKAMEMGYLEEITVKEGQHVKAGDVLFKVRPILYETEFAAETAEANLAQIEFDNTKRLLEKNVVSQQKLLLLEAKLAKANARAKLAGAKLNFATIRAEFDGIIDRLRHQQGSLVREDEVLTTLSDNSVMWVYFNVPESQYLEYKSGSDKEKKLKIELELANHEKFGEAAKNLVIEAVFNNQIGVIPFRADFPNPDRLLVQGQTGTVLISRVQKDALVIPQRATFPILQKEYVYVIDKEDVVHQREIEKDYELEDVYVIKGGLSADDRIVLEGTRQIHDGDKVEYEDRQPEEVLAQLKNHAE